MHVRIRRIVTTGSPRTGLSSRIGIMPLRRAARPPRALAQRLAFRRLREPRRLLGERDRNGVFDDAHAREIPVGRASPAQNGQRNTALLRDDLRDGQTIDRNGRCSDAGSLERSAERRVGFRDEIVLLLGEGRMNLEVELAVAPTGKHGLVDEPHLGAARDARKQRFDVLGVQANAAMTRAHADSGRLVGAVNQIAG